MAEIRNLTRNGETFYPLTHVDAIVSNTGSGIDDVPTLDSENLVKSGGIFNSFGEKKRQFTNNQMINSIFEELWIPDAIEGDYVYKIGHNAGSDGLFFLEIKNSINPSAIRFYIETSVEEEFIGYHSFEPYSSQLINIKVRWLIPSSKNLVTTYNSFTGTYETSRLNLDVVKSEDYNPICCSTNGNLVGEFIEIPHTTVINGKYWYNGSDHVIDGYSYFVLNVQEGETYKITNVSEWDARICLAKENNSMYACYPESSSNTKQDTYIIHVAFLVTKLYINFPTKYLDVIKVEKYCLFNDTQKIQKRWCVLGDSLSAPSTLGTLWCYTNYIAQDFNFNLNNLAVSGTGYIKTSSNFVNKSRNLTDVYDVITVFGSFNDLWLPSESGGGVIPSSMFGDVTDTGTDTIAGCIYNTIKNIRDNCPSANLGIIIPTPWSSVNNIGTSTINEYGERYSNLIENMCKKYSVPVLDLYHYSGIHPWDSYFNNKYFLNSDGCHPNTMGHYTFIYPRVKEFIKSLMK